MLNIYLCGFQITQPEAMHMLTHQLPTTVVPSTAWIALVMWYMPCKPAYTKILQNFELPEYIMLYLFDIVMLKCYTSFLVNFVYLFFTPVLFLSICIGRIRPLGECVLLQQETEVIVTRYTSVVPTESKMTEHAPATPPTPSLFKKSKKMVVNEMAPLDVSQSLSLYTGLFQYLQSFFMWSNAQPESQHAELVCRKGDFSPDSVSMTLRVQGFNERWDMFKNIQDSCQSNSLKRKHFLKNPGLVFVNICDVTEQCNLVKSIPQVFFAKMVKLRSPRESLGAKPEPVSKRHSSSEDPNHLSNIVQVCLVGTHEMICEEDSTLTSLLNENSVLPGHVMVPNPLRVVQQLEVTSKVELEGIRAHRVKLRYLYILPLRVTVSHFLYITISLFLEKSLLW